MTEREVRPGDDEARIDGLLREAFEAPQGLPREFEHNVMGQIQARPRNWLATHAVFLVMCVYWTLTASLSAWLILGGEVGVPSLDVIGIALFVMALCVAPLLWVMRKFGVQFAPLILKTLQ